MRSKFVSDDFIVPEKLETNKYRFRMLTVDDVEKDYEAVMSSKEHLRSLSDSEDNDPWPNDDMTIQENLEDLKRHQEEFLKREAFVYTVVTLDETKCLGCVYIDPSEVEQYEAEIYLWAIQSELENGLEESLYQTVKKWIKEVWPWEKVVYPGRDISIAEWKNYKQK